MALSNPLEQFIIKPIFPLEVLGVDISFTQSALCMFITVLITTLLIGMTIRKKVLIPGRWQNISEMIYEFVSDIVDENIGSKGRKYFPFVFSIFMTILIGNLLGLVPYSFTFTSHIIVTGALAMMVFLFATALGIVLHGFSFLSLFLPKGVPKIIAPLVFVIEIISYLSRPLSLSVRLFANMVAGHTMMKVFAGFSVSLGIVLGMIPMVTNIALYGLEILIATIQAYVFAILTCIYLRDAIELH